VQHVINSEDFESTKDSLYSHFPERNTVGRF
jgi:hypothetical protein